jgi:hypothetical protein
MLTIAFATNATKKAPYLDLDMVPYTLLGAREET